VRDGGAQQEQRSGQVDAHHLVPVPQRHVADGSAASDTRVQHQPVEASVRGQGRLDEPLGRVGVPDVGRVCQRSRLLREALQGFGPPAGDDHVVARLAQQPGRGLPDARASTGHDDNALVLHRSSGPFTEFDQIDEITWRARRIRA
jgi:hypothetical protein